MTTTQRPLIAITVCILLSACAKQSKFPIEKRYWTPEDYTNAIAQIQYTTPEGEQYPRFINPETSIIIKKLVDPQNYEVILDDNQLGLNHRNEVAQQFFDEYR